MAGAVCKYYFRSVNVFPRLWTQSYRLKSDVHVAVTDDSSTVVFWHPEKSFPYEMSLPVPEKKVIKSNTILKMESNKEFLAALKNKTPNEIAVQLGRITHTTKHIWFPRKFQFRRKKKAQDDRPYL